MVLFRVIPFSPFQIGTYHFYNSLLFFNMIKPQTISVHIWTFESMIFYDEHMGRAGSGNTALLDSPQRRCQCLGDMCDLNSTVHYKNTCKECS